MEYWALLDLQMCYFQGTLQVYTVTDRPIHQVLRWNNSLGGLATTWPERRGLPHQLREWKYPSQWFAIGQLEPGDTLTHTFYWPNWPPITTRYFIITAAYLYPTSGSHSGPYHYRSPSTWSYRLVFNELWSS